MTDKQPTFSGHLVDLSQPKEPRLDWSDMDNTVSDEQHGRYVTAQAIDHALLALKAEQPAQAEIERLKAELDEWELAAHAARIAPNTGMVPVKSAAIIAINEELNRLRAAQQPAAQGEPVAGLPPLMMREVYDAIRGAYDLGYNDARNAGAVSGDGAPGYDGRSVEADHGCALANRLVYLMQRQASHPSPAAQVPDGWRIAKSSDGLEISIAGPGGCCKVHKREGNATDLMFFRLVDALLAASQPAAQSQEGASDA